ncbi:phosphoribosyltransferase-like protein [Ligilactobacillus murinus]|uniref:PRTase-CE domain-containing protein n=1 Tax=Ligilactobacillus murinus TaxID=1622 RepID=A0AAD0P8E5_9LACO|nr:hypothetical protein [Ligilactobacillus murinus]AWZ39319.1 hypothetical protein CPS94_10510 [Ligilactobacillus murinus]AWZ39710.1 hypothetical protein CPQ89_00995 [Ligilactobacillus murinus]
MEDIYKKYLKITSKNIIDIKDDRDIIEMLDFQKNFFNSKPEARKYYFNMLDEYRYYTRDDMLKFIKKYSGILNEPNIIINPLTMEKNRVESSNLTYNLFCEGVKDGKYKLSRLETDELFYEVVNIREKHKALKDKRIGKEISDAEYIEEKKRLSQKGKSYGIANVFRLEKIIIFDDFVGTGNSLVNKFLKKNSENIQELGQLNIEVVMLLLEVSKEAEQLIKKFIDENRLQNVVRYYKCATMTEYSNTKAVETINSLAKVKANRYSKKALVSTYTDTPNSTVENFWQENEFWKPMFRRANRNIQEKYNMDNLNRTLEKYDFRYSSINIGSGGGINKKVCMKGLILLKKISDKVNPKLGDVIKIFCDCLAIQDGTALDLVDLFNEAKLIEYKNDEIYLTKRGEGILSNIKWKSCYKLPNDDILYK